MAPGGPAAVPQTPRRCARRSPTPRWAVAARDQKVHKTRGYADINATSPWGPSQTRHRVGRVAARDQKVHKTRGYADINATSPYGAPSGVSAAWGPDAQHRCAALLLGGAPCPAGPFEQASAAPPSAAITP